MKNTLRITQHIVQENYLDFLIAEYSSIRDTVRLLESLSILRSEISLFLAIDRTYLDVTKSGLCHCVDKNLESFPQTDRFLYISLPILETLDFSQLAKINLLARGFAQNNEDPWPLQRSL